MLLNNEKKGTRLILGVTGIRSDYDIMSSVYEAIVNKPNLSLEIAVTGAHLSSVYGYTVSQIEKDGFKIVDKIDSLLNSNSESSRVKGLGIQLQGLVQTVERVDPDMLLVLGDREESISTALVGSYMNIPVAHVCGGDRVVGNVDDQVRHAVTKLSHLHFTSNMESYERIIRLGEQRFRIHNVGNPGLDRFKKLKRLSLAEISNRLNVELTTGLPIVVLIQHVLSTETEYAYQQMRTTLEALRELKVQVILSSPNSDAGSNELRRAIAEVYKTKNFHVFKNIDRDVFVNLLRHASCLVGNSSSGILEAPLLRLPVVNIGNRQKGRLHAQNVQFVSHDKQEIVLAVQKALYDMKYIKLVEECDNPYGDGYASEKIAEVLSRVDLDDRLLIKDITY
jgi:GDP/UDP-N,N'-diacetylbacillosamine 2-epimerase (hydrolysing)